MVPLVAPHWGAPRILGTSFVTLLHWSSALLRGLGISTGISLLAVGLGTLVGLTTDALYLLPVRGLRHFVGVYAIASRNASWFVLVYGIAYAVPFETVVRGHVIPFPNWLKVTSALVLSASAYVAEILRDIVQSIPQMQWETAVLLVLTRRDVLWRIVLPQCMQHMLPSWMNLYIVITMGTVLTFLVGVHDPLDTVQIISNTIDRTPLTILTCFIVPAPFSLYCYPISCLTRRMGCAHIAA